MKLIDADKLLEWARKNQFPEPHSSRMHIDAFELGKILFSSELSPWVSAKTKLPDRGGYVLARYKDCLPFIAMYHEINSKFTCESDEIPVTHWMPLPEVE